MNPALNPEFRYTISTSRTQAICIEEQIRLHSTASNHTLTDLRISSEGLEPQKHTDR